jgi:hypothetical protein
MDERAWGETLRGMPQLRIAEDAAADELLGRDPLALVGGMLLDQHMRQRSSDVRLCICSRGS